MPVVQRPYVPPEDQTPNEETYARPGDTQASAGEAGSLDPITFYADSMHIFSSLYSAVLFFGEQMEEREPIPPRPHQGQPPDAQGHRPAHRQARPRVRGRRRPHHPAGAGLRRLGAGHGGGITTMPDNEPSGAAGVPEDRPLAEDPGVARGRPAGR